MSAEPRFATPRTPERRTLGAEASRVARALGFELMDWQQRVFDVALELDPATGHFAFRDVIVTSPRQQGKSSALLVLIALRALRSRSRIIYGAQSGSDARQKLQDDWLPLIDASPLKPHVAARLANGREALLFSNGSLARLISNSPKSGHGASVDLALLDEAFADVDNRREQSVRPAMMTRPDGQLWITSTAGTPGQSPFLWEKVQLGREAAASGLRQGLAYFEWSAAEDDDPADPATWARCMPAYGITCREAGIANDFRSMDLTEFKRAFLNVWTSARVEPVIPLGVWDSLADPTSQPLDPVAIAFDVSPDRSSAAIAAAGKRADERMHVEIIDHRPGTAWLTERVALIARRQEPCAVVADATGPAGAMLPELERLGVKVTTTGARDQAQACGLFYDAATNDKLRHLGTSELRTALDGAVKRPLGDAWAWSRKGSGVDICPLVAGTLAVWGAQVHSTEAPEVWDLNEIVAELRARQATQPAQPQETTQQMPAGVRRVSMKEVHGIAR